MTAYEHVQRTEHGPKLTYRDFLRFPDDGQRHELIDGVHVVTPSPSFRHQIVSTNLLGAMWAFLQRTPIGRVLHAPFDVVFSNFDVVEPDLLYVSNVRAGEVFTPKHAVAAPDLVVEIGSPGTRRRDETIKLRLYERCGVTEYWVFDPARETVRVYRAGERGPEGRFERVTELSVEHRDTLTTPLLPGFEVSLAAIFEASPGASLEA